MRKITYGGAITGIEEERAIIKSIRKSRKTRNWQAAEEAAKMEKEAARYLGVKYCVLTSSGSCAGLLALSALELPKGSEVIISATTFPTIFNIIIQCGLVPVVVDAKVGTYTFDVKEVEQAVSPKTKAIIAIHPVGNPADMPALMKVARKHDVYVLEDACDSWGGSINGKKLGSFGDVSFTSFHAAHIISMGVGGAVFTDDNVIAQNVRMYRDWGRQADTAQLNRYKELPKDYNPRFIYEKIGYNFQILDLQAAMGRVQLKKTEKIKKLRKRNFDYLYKHLSQYGDLVMPESVKGADVCWFAFPLTYAGDRGKLVKHLEKRGIETRSMFAGNIIRHPCYEGVEYRIGSDLTEADLILKHSFWVGVHPRMTEDDRKYMVKAFQSYFEKTA